ncbi:hypothetical protein [Rubellimicrobium arenae]|uniref:hypothetical protein n=1 Tax=Rubellimicrobium arenae TaxID=2817372 RepID=UPI001B30A3E7|nr:hypothetical protein [Rubellimicrobium arenae]
MPLALVATFMAAPLAAQPTEDDQSLLGQGADLLLRGLIEEVAPPLQDLAGIGAEYLPLFQQLAAEMGPAFLEVFGQIDSLSNYEPPEILPNGDILLRRSPDAPAWTPPGAEPAPAAPSSRPQVEL